MRILRRVYFVVVMVMATSALVFAGVDSAGQNAGEWFTGQLWYIALAILAFMAIKYLVKKAWVPAGVFFAIGGILLYIISNPEKLQQIGESLFNIIFQ